MVTYRVIVICLNIAICLNTVICLATVSLYMRIYPCLQVYLHVHWYIFDKFKFILALTFYSQLNLSGFS